MSEVEWNEDEDVNKVVETYYTVDGFSVHIRIGVEQENSDHPIWIHVERDRWYTQAEIDPGHADLDQAKAMASKFAALLLQEAKAQRDEALAEVEDSE